MSSKGIWVDSRTFVDFSVVGRTDKSLAGEIATRSRSIDFAFLTAFLPNPDPILKKLGQDQRVYNELLVDPHVGACESSRKAGVNSLLWEINRGKAKSQPAKVLEDLFRDLDLDRIIDEILDAPAFGYQPLEVIWGRVGGLVLPIDIKAKPREWFQFDPDGNLRFLTRHDMFHGEELPDRKFLLPRHRASYANPYGRPVLGKCFWPVIFKRNGLKFWAIFTERYGMPWVVVKHPRGAEQAEINASLDMAEQMVQDAVAAIPDDSSVEIIEAGGKSASADIYEKLLDWCNAEVSKAWLGQTLTTQVGDRGSYAAANIHRQVMDDITDADKRLVESTLNTLIGWIHDFNFTGPAPTFQMWAEEDVDKDLADRDEVLSKALGPGRRLSTKYFLRAYNLEEDDIDEDAPGQEKEFSEPSGQPAELDALDNLLRGIPAEEMQAQMDQTLGPLIEMAAQGGSYEEIMTGLTEAFPRLDTDALEEKLARVIFIGHLWGRINGQE